MHPAKANVYLLKYLIKRYTQPSEMILDPMAGTGSTIVLAGLFGRRGIAIDIEDRFIEWAKRNIARLKAVKPDAHVEAIQGDSRRLTELLVRDVDVALFSPPFASEQFVSSERNRSEYFKKAGVGMGIGHSRYIRRELYSGDKQNIGNLQYGSVDAVITSPPYEGSVSTKGDPERRAERLIKAGLDPQTFVHGKAACCRIDWRYSEDKRNIGNLKGETYLEAMSKVYSECFKALKPKGLMILIVKPFIRRGRVVDLPWHTWLLCKRIGFILREVLAIRLPQKSFWRIIFRRKNPGVTAIKHEYVLIMQKP